MKHVLPALFLVALPLAPVAAQDVPAAGDVPVSQDLGVTGRTPEVCSLGNGRFKVSELDNFVDTAGDTLRVVQLLDPENLSVRSARATIAVEAVCNFPHRVMLESQDNGLFPLGGPFAAERGDFASALPYAATMEWADQTRLLELNAKIRRPSVIETDVDQAAAGELVIKLELDAGASNTVYGAPVLAGAYGDTLRITLEPR